MATFFVKYHSKTLHGRYFFITATSLISCIDKSSSSNQYIKQILHMIQRHSYISLIPSQIIRRREIPYISAYTYTVPMSWKVSQHYLMWSYTATHLIATSGNFRMQSFLGIIPTILLSLYFHAYFMYFVA